MPLRRPLSRFTAFALLAGSLAGCSAESTAPTEVTSGAPVTALEVEATPGEMEGLARALAIGLGSVEGRGALMGAMGRSRHTEGKTYLTRLLGHPSARQLQEEVASALGISADEMMARLQRTEPIEVYLPVPEHRARWRPTDGVLVATSERDHEAPTAFSADGQRHLLSAGAPPVNFVVALLRAEQILPAEGGPQTAICYPTEENPCSTGGGGTGGGDTGGGGSGGGGTGGGGGGGTTYDMYEGLSPGLYLSLSQINGDYEGWLRGSPEIEWDLIAANGSVTRKKIYGCIHEDSQSGARNLNQNEGTWTARRDANVWVKPRNLMNEAEYAAIRSAYPPGTALDSIEFYVQVWEDDHSRCFVYTPENSSYGWKEYLAASALVANGTGASISLITVGGGLFELAAIYWGIRVGIELIDHAFGWAYDDYVGTAIDAGAWQAATGESITTSHAIVNRTRRIGKLELHWHGGLGTP